MPDEVHGDPDFELDHPLNTVSVLGQSDGALIVRSSNSKTFRLSANGSLDTPFGNGSVRASYKLTSADDIWNSADNGEYIIRSRGGAVLDVNGVGNIARALGSFRIAIA